MWGQLSFQDSNSPIMNALISFHDQAMVSIILITAYVAFMMMMILTQNHTTKSPHENHELEAIWTLSPALILMTLALPSLRLLYLLDEVATPSITIKTTGHQWYWSYDYADFNTLVFDSYMTPTEELSMGEFRLLEVDNRLVLPWGVESRILITAADVLHSWTIPSMGVKADAVPGRLNQVTLFPMRPGVFYGQCSEICGANHSFMPISLEIIKPEKWFSWVENSIQD
uniref:Cytochrome c oxidase subunit 2 n=1 Tax=Typosyllis antoni TaxID=1898412 RepID=A0A1C9UZF9_9ANNE|nr:cytochrome c oxidase subunit II [Typosyllis antoni]AOR87156.1 cytochrome c oxidase subunit II [Typosyllis antoni]